MNLKTKVPAVLLAIVAGFCLFAIAQDGFALGQTLSSVEAEATSVTTTAELVTGDMTSGNIHGWKSCTVWNNTATLLYLGGPGVTSAEGFPICNDTATCPAASMTVDARNLYYIAASGTLTPRVICGK